MKFFLLFLISTGAHAVSIAKYISTPDAVSEQRFELNKGQAKYVKASNFFDLKNQNALGVFETKSLKISKIEVRLEEVLKKVKSADDFLKSKKSSFNDLSDKSPHASFIYLNDYRITQKSELYPELKNLFEELQGEAWKQKSGIRLSDDYKTVITISDGKEISKEPFQFEFYCRQPSGQTTCQYKKLGVLHVERK